MRRRNEVLAVLIGLIATPSLLVAYHFSKMPLQPVHPAMARVVAIAPWGGKFHADRDTIVIRNAHGTGELILREGEVRCRVGDVVPVEQQGVSLRPVARTCR